MRLYIVRHAEAEERFPGHRDYDRVLTARGLRQARSLARLFRANAALADKRPDSILSSPAPRALQTATIIGASAEVAVALEHRLGLDADVDDVRSLVRELAVSNARRPMIVGHNPTFEDFAASIGAGSGLRKAEMISVEIEVAPRSLTGRKFERFRGED